jgi:hypothetical protein
MAQFQGQMVEFVRPRKAHSGWLEQRFQINFSSRNCFKQLSLNHQLHFALLQRDPVN